MATTKIWDVKSNLARVIEYANNPEKTLNKQFARRDIQELRDVMDYACDDFKTEKQFYVSGLNCDPANARRQMIRTKQRYDKTGGITAFHAYQSFAPGEVTAKLAHEIGVELARRLWGDRFEVVVATHLNTRCYHNHFVLNSVSFADGKRYYDNKATYRLMRQVSDELCRARSLSVIESPLMRGKSYVEWKAEQEDKPTYSSIVRGDVDRCIAASLTFAEFVRSLESLGYEVDSSGKYLKVKAPGRDRFRRLKTLGENYTEERVKKRIADNRFAVPLRTVRRARRVRFCGNLKGTKKLTGIRALYYHYLYKMGILPKKKAPVRTKQASFLLRQDIVRMEQISKETRFIAANRIDTAEQLEARKAKSAGQITALCISRQKLYDRLRRCREQDKMDIKVEIAAMSAQIKQLETEVTLCDGVLARSVDMNRKLSAVKQEEQQDNAKQEVKQNERFRRRG